MDYSVDFVFAHDVVVEPDGVGQHLVEDDASDRCLNPVVRVANGDGFSCGGVDPNTGTAGDSNANSVSQPDFASFFCVSSFLEVSIVFDPGVPVGS